MRKLVFVVLLAGSVLVPYAMTNKDWYPQLKAKWTEFWTPAAGTANESWTTRASRSIGAMFGSKPAAAPGPLVPNAKQTPLVGEQVKDLAEIIRFDISPDWVVNRWGRVSIVHSEPGLEGMRVAAVTGVEANDLAGALTYYFDSQRVVQRVTFRGVTGDQQRIVDLAVRTYQFKRDPSVVTEQYTARTSGKISSVLRLEHAPVVRSAQPLSRFDVLLEINRPNNAFGLSRDMQVLLTTDSTYVHR